MNKVKAFYQLVRDDRLKIEVLLQQGLSLRKIAFQLGRSASTISREIHRNRRAWKGPYDGALADKKTLHRHRHKPKRVIFDESMKLRVANLLTQRKFSPELISVTGNQERQDFVSHEWIYQWIWAMKFSQSKHHKQWKELYMHLKHGKRRKRRGKQHCKRGNILKRVWIDKRPASVDTRRRFGHLEADLISGRGRKASLLVVMERKSRKIWIEKPENKQSGTVAKYLKKICLENKRPVKTITFDNDLAFADHYKLHAHGISTYFTHPFSSQEKGSIENRIGIIRMFFDKRTAFNEVTKKEVKSVEEKLNNRPLRMFNYKTPNEVYLNHCCIN
jgi:IS30 family transposase